MEILMNILEVLMVALIIPASILLQLFAMSADFERPDKMIDWKNKFKHLFEEDKKIVTATYDSFNISNAIDTIDHLVANSPIDLNSIDFQLRMSRAYFNTLKCAIRTANRFNVLDNEDSLHSFPMSGYSNVTIIADSELNVSNNIILTY